MLKTKGGVVLSKVTGGSSTEIKGATVDALYISRLGLILEEHDLDGVMYH